MSAARGNVRDQLLRLSGGLEIAVLIGVSHQRAGVGHIDPLWIRSGRIEVYAECCRETSVHRRFPRLAVGGDAAEDSNRSAACIRHEDVTVRSPAHLPRDL